MFRAEVQPHPPGVLALRSAAALSVLAAGARLAEGGVPTCEARVFNTLNRTPPVISAVLWLPMQFGSLWGPVGVGAAIWRLRRDRRTAIGVAAAGILAWQAAKVVKKRVGRGRPWVEVDEIEHRGGTPYEGLGYVSGHTAVGAAMAAYLGPQLSRSGRAVTWLCVAGIAFGRLHVSAHLPLDLLGGAALGVVVGDAVGAVQPG